MPPLYGSVLCNLFRGSCCVQARVHSNQAALPHSMSNRASAQNAGSRRSGSVPVGKRLGRSNSTAYTLTARAAVSQSSLLLVSRTRSRRISRARVATPVSYFAGGGGDDERVDGALIASDACSLVFTIWSSDRIPASEGVAMMATFTAAWILVSGVRGDYGPDAEYRSLEWTWGPVGASLYSGALTWLFWAPPTLIAWFAFVQSVPGMSMGDASTPGPAGWAPPAVEVLQAALVIVPVFRGVRRGLSQLPW